jgi:hypothetical protein
MSEDDDVVGKEIKDVGNLCDQRNIQKNIFDGSGCQFVSSFGRGIGIAGATKHTHMFI